jgi:hypothetical protein
LATVKANNLYFSGTFTKSNVDGFQITNTNDTTIIDEREGCFLHSFLLLINMGVFIAILQLSFCL